MISDETIRTTAQKMYFKYAENMTGAYVGLSTVLIFDLMKSYFSSGQLPEILKINDRVDLFEIATQMADVSGEELDKLILDIWNSRKDIRKWYDFPYYEGLMKVYRQRGIRQSIQKPEFILPNKEDMDMATLKEYYPEYYEELREYVFQNAYNSKTGLYVAAQPSENGEYFSSPHRKLFEIDHIIPISDAKGKTVKENLQLLYYKDNRKKSNKKPKI